jgi:multicomponent Na+:H+ antiporter subunit F
MSVVYVVTLSLLAVSGLGCLVRLMRGPSRFDRVVALDMLVIVVMSGIAVEAAWRREGANVLLIAVVALVGFLGTVGVTRLVPDEERP